MPPKRPSHINVRVNWDTRKGLAVCVCGETEPLLDVGQVMKTSDTLHAFYDLHEKCGGTYGQEKHNSSPEDSGDPSGVL